MYMYTNNRGNTVHCAGGSTITKQEKIDTIIKAFGFCNASDDNELHLLWRNAWTRLSEEKARKE